MATDITATLGLDDTQYTAKLKAAETQAKTFGTAFDSAMVKAKESVNKLSEGVETINQKFEGLTKLLVGAGIVEFTHSLLESANQLKDMAAATDVSIARLAEMGVAASQSGSSLEGVANMLGKMEINAYDANKGNLDLVNSFAKVGISIKDMHELSPDELFKKAASALAEMNDQSQRVAVGVQLFGKAAKGFDWGGYKESIKETEGTMDAFGESQKKAADLSEALNTQAMLVKGSFLALLEPILNLIAPTGDMSDKMAKAKVTAEVLAAALAAFGAGVAINGLIAVGNAVKSVGAWFTTATVAVEGSTAITGQNTVAMTLNANAAVFMAGAHGRLGTATTAVAAAEEALNAACIAGVTDVAILTKLEDALTAARERLTIMTAATIKTQEGMAATLAVLGGAETEAAVATTALGTSMTAMAAATAKSLAVLAVAGAAIAGIAGTIQALYNTFVEDKGGKNFVNDYIQGLFGNSDEQLAAKAKLDGYLASLSKSQKDAYDKMDAEGKAAVLNALMQKDQMKAIAAANELLDGKKPDEKKEGDKPKKPGTVTEPTKNPLMDAAIVQAFDLKNQAELANKQQAYAQARIALQTAYAGQSKSDLESALAGYDAEVKYLNDQQKLKDTIAKLDIEISKAEGAKAAPLIVVRNEYERQLKALKDLSPEVALNKKNELDRAAAVERTTYYMDIEKKAKESILAMDEQIADLTKSATQIQLESIDKIIAKEKEAAMAKLQAQAGPNGTVDIGIAAEAMEKIDQAYAGLKVKNQQLILQSRDFSTGWKKAMADYVDNVGNEAQRAAALFQQATTSMEDAIVNFAQTGKFEWRTMVNDMLTTLLRSQIQQTMANIFTGGKAGGTSGGLFGGKIIPGFLASGGPAASGKPYIVGEQGPELFVPSTAGTVQPNSTLGGGQNVTYNISAVDARSFQALVAQDPQFIHAVAMAGARNTASYA